MLFSLPLPHQFQILMENEIQTITQTEVQPEVQSQPQTTTCLNCGNEFEGNFCPECGQSADTGRFTVRFIIENLLAAFLSKDGGIWFTLKSLFTRPGAMIVDILNGKRRKYFSPFPMLLCSLTLYVLILSFSGSHEDYRKLENKLQEIEVEGRYNIDTEAPNVDLDKEINLTTKKLLSKILGYAVSFYNNHYTLLYMLTLPLFVTAARKCYGKANRKRYNRAEYVVAIVYALVMVVLYRCIVSLIYLISPNLSENLGFTMPFVIAAAFTACFNKMMGFSIGKTIWRSVLATTLYFLLLANLFVIAIIGVIIYLAIKFS